MIPIFSLAPLVFILLFFIVLFIVLTVDTSYSVKLKVLDFIEETLVKETKLSKSIKLFDHYVTTVILRENKIVTIQTEEFYINYKDNQASISLNNGNTKGYLLDNEKQLEELKNFEEKFFKRYNKKKPVICKSIDKWNLTSDKKEKK